MQERSLQKYVNNSLEFAQDLITDMLPSGVKHTSKGIIFFDLREPPVQFVPLKLNSSNTPLLQVVTFVTVMSSSIIISVVSFEKFFTRGQLEQVLSHWYLIVMI